MLLEFLEAEQSRGVTHVHLDEGAREGLREVYALARSGGVASVNDAPAAPTSATAVPVPEISLTSEPEPTVVTSAAVTPVSKLSISGATKADQLAALRRQAENWAPAKALGTLRDVMVFATGNPDARVMFVGEAPGYQDERDREPFVGPAGQKLNDILKAMSLSREVVYLSHIVQFRPATVRQTTNNRKPTPEEMTACLPFIRAEIGIVKPECVVVLGTSAAEGLLGLEGAVISMRGPWHDFEGTPARVTYHPSALLQSGGPSPVKRQLWEDMLAVMEKLGLPISAKQRGYFLPK